FLAFASSAEIRNPLGSRKRVASGVRSVLREQHLEDTLPQSCFAPPAIMVDDGFPWPEVCGQIAPRASCVRHPEHRFHAPAPLFCRAISPGLRWLKQRTQSLPHRIGERRQTGQTDRFRQEVRTRERRGLTGTALQVAALRSRLMSAAEA